MEAIGINVGYLIIQLLIMGSVFALTVFAIFGVLKLIQRGKDNHE